MQFRLCTLVLLILGWIGEAQIFGQEATSVTLASLPTGSVASGTVVTLGASVTGSGGPVLSGQVAFFDGAKNIGVIPVVRNSAAGYVPGSATLRKMFGAGGHSIHAVYEGTSSEQTSTSAIGTLTVAAGAGTPSAGLVYGTTRYFGQMSRVESVVLTDINNDGVLDLLAPQFGFSNVAISLGDPLHPGTFLAPTFLGVSSSAIEYCAAVDLNGDGLPDIVTTGADGDPAYVILQDPAHPGSFLSGKPVGSATTEPLIADMNHDGIPDLILIGSSITVLLGDPQNPGAFQPGSTTTLGTFDFRWAAVADMNGDGLPDIAINSENAQTVSVWLNDATHPGRLLAKTDYPAGGSMFGIAVGDMNGDGRPDVVLGNPSGSVGVLLNDGTNPGQLLAPHSYSVLAAGWGRSMGFGVGDIDGDGVLDVVSANYDSALDVALGRGDGTLGAAIAYTTGPSSDTFQPGPIAIGDIDGDGLNDVAVGQFYQNSAQVFLHQPDSHSLLVTAADMSLSGRAVQLGGPLTINIKVSSGSGPPMGSVLLYDTSGTANYSLIATVPLDSTGTAIFSSSSLALGSHDFLAYFPGDSTYAPSTSLTASVNVLPATRAIVTETLTAAPNPAAVGQLVTFTATVTATGPAPTGLVVFLDIQNNPLAFVQLNAEGVAVYQTSSLQRGTHTIQAAYQGNIPYVAQLQTVYEVIGDQTAVLALRLNASANPATAGQAVQFTATVTSSGVAPTGTVTFLDNGRQIGQIALTAGSAIVNTNSMTVGTHTIQATYSGDSNYGSQTQTLSEVVNAAATVTTLSVSPNPALVSQAVSVKATVTGTVIPTGTVTFFDGATLIGSGILDLNGNATLTTTALQTGTHPLTAMFNANSSGAASTSQVVNEVIQAVVSSPPDFELTTNSTLTLHSEQQGTASITVTPSGGLSDSVSVNCGTLPVYATCTVVPGQVQLSNGTAQTVSIQISISRVPASASLRQGLGTAFAFVLPWLLFGPSSRRGVGQRLLLVALIALSSGAVTGCSDRYSRATPPVTSNIVISGHGQTTGLNRTTTLTLVVTP